MSRPPWIQVAAAIVEHQGSYLISRRHATSHLGGCWEFPGGKQEFGESLESCVQRELLEELGVRVKVVAPFKVVQHKYPDKAVELHFFCCVMVEGSPQALGCQECRWVKPEDFRLYAFPPADESVIHDLLTTSL